MSTVFFTFFAIALLFTGAFIESKYEEHHHVAETMNDRPSKALRPYYRAAYVLSGCCFLLAFFSACAPTTEEECIKKIHGA